MDSQPATSARRFANRLLSQPSAYLRQHAYNPVDWYPWGDEALARAAAEDKPIFLSVGYSSCHWCHVMEHECFEDEEIAELLGESYIAIKVDREERPDLDAVYMTALQMMTGSGGWPMSLFLTPDLKPFYGATYVPRDNFAGLLRALAAAFREQREKIHAMGAEMAGYLAEPQKIVAAQLDSATAQSAVAEDIVRNTDSEWGGLTGRMKFPTAPLWAFALRRYRRTGDEGLAAALRKTLNGMAGGGIQDQLGGGFHRYTVEPTWTIPHFEKMLYDNAQLAQLYIEAGQVFGVPCYIAVGQRTLDFMLRELRDAHNPAGFFSSYDADSAGEEGSYYVWTPEEFAALAGPVEGPALAMLLGCEPGGNFEERSVLTQRVPAERVATALGLDLETTRSLLYKWRPALLKQRAQRSAPALDRKVVTSWNGLAISACSLAYLAYHDEQYRQAAEQAADYLWTVHRRDDGSLWRSSTDGVAAGPGVLDDYAAFALGLLDLYTATGEIAQLQRALAVLGYARHHFAHPAAGCYFTAEDDEAPLGRQWLVTDSVEPSGNALLLQALARAAALTEREGYAEDAEKLIGALGGLWLRQGAQMPASLSAAELAAGGGLLTVVIAGDAADPLTEQLLEVYRSLLPAQAALVRIPAAGADELTQSLIPATHLKSAPGGKATADVCRQGACQAPTSDPQVLREQIMQGWKH